jgi:hypothetical protein
VRAVSGASGRRSPAHDDGIESVVLRARCVVLDASGGAEEHPLPV